MLSRVLRYTTLLTIVLFFSLIGQGQVVAKFSSDTTKGCSPVTIKFKDQSTGSNLNYLWTFGNGNVSTLKDPQAIYYVPGKYEVKLTVTDPSGSKSTEVKTAYIEVFKNPEAKFSGKPLNGCVPLVVDFKENSKLGDGRIKKWIWDFGDGNTSKDSIGKHTFKSAGDFTISLLVTDVNGCEDKHIETNYVHTDITPEVKFNADRNYYCKVPVTINFTDQSKNASSNDTYAWDFGDGKTSSDKNPSHEYKSYGTYDVKLTITKSNGCSGSLTLKDYIILGPLEPEIEADKTIGCAPLEVSFKNQTKPTTNGMNFTWDFGDGTTAGGKDAVHTFTNPGYYTIKLTAIVDSDCKETITYTDYIEVQKGPIADFTLDKTQSCKVPFSVTVENKSKDASKISWDINGEDKGSSYSNYFTFDKFGTYWIGLKATNFIGCSDYLKKKVEIKPLEVDIDANIKGGCIPLTVKFTDNSNNWDEVKSKNWTFGDGSSVDSNQKSVFHVFQDTGTFKIYLRIETESGCTGIDSVMVLAGMKTNPDFKEIKDTFCNLEDVIFYNQSELENPHVDSIIWQIHPPGKNEAFSNQKDGILRTDMDSGWVDIRLILQHNLCYDTTIKKKQLYIDPPNAKMEVKAEDSCNAFERIYVNKSQGADSFVWYVNSFSHGKETFFEDILKLDESYKGASVWLKAWNFRTGCIDSLAKQPIKFVIGAKAIINFSGNFCAPAFLTFDAFPYENNEFIWHTSLNDTVKGRILKMNHDGPGDFWVALKATNPDDGCTANDTFKYKIKGPIVEGEMTGKEGCAPVEVSLQSKSDPKNFKELFWLIGNDTIKVTDTKEFDYTILKPGPQSDGTYGIKLIGIDSNGCQGVDSFPFKVTGVLNSSIKVRRFAQCDGKKFIFQLLAPGYDLTTLDVEWNFGDGTKGTKIAENKTFKGTGIYNVTCTIKEPNGCTTVLSETMDIEKEQLFADFNADSLATDCPPLFVQFRDLSLAKGRKVTNWLWEFGDGSTSIEKNPSKLYLTAGTFTVKLFIEDDWGCTDSVVYPDFVLVKGPEGSYNFDKKNGCVPLTVNFEAKTKGTQFMEWDMGDGNVINDTNKLSHTYYQPGRYIPLLILEDSFGCSYTLPPIDTIFVDPYPLPEFTYDGYCYGQPISFYAQDNSGFPIEQYKWEFEQNNTTVISYEKDPVFTFSKGTIPVVKLTTTTVSGCSNTIEKELNLYKLLANFIAESKFNCVGNKIEITNTSITDTTLISFEWEIKGQTYTSNTVFVTADKVGPLPIILRVANVLGCKDTLDSPHIIIGDTITPPSVDMLRVTVVDDNTVQLDHKKSAMTDFDSYLYFKDNGSYFEMVGEQSKQSELSYFDNSTNTLDNVYCYKIAARNTCGIISDTINTKTHCTVEVEAKGVINASILDWNHYSGWNNIKEYRIYREDLANKNQFLQIAVIPGDKTSYIDSSISCHVLHRYKVEAVEQGGNLQVSFSDTCAALPIWISTLEPNEMIRASVVDDLEITLDWDSVHKSRMPIASYVIEKSKDGVTYTFLKQLDPFTFTTMDADVLVDDQSYFYRSYAIDVCGDTSPYSNYAKTILLKADTTREQRPILNWSTYKGWDVGVNYYTIEIKNPDGSFTQIGNTTFSDSTLIDEVTRLNQRPEYCYRIIGHRNTISGKPDVISISNEDCSPVKSRLWVPNAFSPNNDGLNDKFVTPGLYIIEYHILIYNRWGELVFESYDIYDNWDGNYLNKPAQQDAYAVIVETLGVDQIIRNHFGTVTLVR